jgi:bifunctional non-homologous end joining protein LigD
LIEGLPYIRLSGKVSSSGKAFFKEAQKLGLEGIMAKKLDSLYFPGIRSEDWLKFKTRNSIDALICGYTISDKRPFGSLILGSTESKNLQYIGNCGTGFSTKIQKELIKKFKPLIRKTSPFGSKIALAGRKPVWMKPQLVAEVFFAEWTEQGLLRQPAFKGLKTEEVQMRVEKNESSKSKNDSKSNSGGTLEIEGINVPVSNLEKELWPNEGITKYDLIDYYLNVSKVILPFLIDRPQNLHRHPNGILESSFYQKDTPETYPDWIQTTPVHSESSNKTIDYLLCQNEATLIYMANLACIEINPWNSKLNSLDHPDYLVIDLDPSPKNSFLEVIEVAQAFHDLLEKLDIKSYCKTSGSSGLHIYLPMGAKYSYEEVREFCKILCTIIQHQLPSLTTMERSLKSRKGRIYLDYLQNRSGQTLASVYCVRPKPGAPVSTPLLWKEVNSKLDKEAFNIFTIEERIKSHPSLFTEVLGKAIAIEKALLKLEEI